MFSIRYNRATNHIAGIAAKCTSSGEERGGVVVEYAENACGVLTRGRLAQGASFEGLQAALDAARITGGRKVCKTCEKAALAAIAAEQEAADAAMTMADQALSEDVVEIAATIAEMDRVEGAEHQVGDKLYFLPGERPHGYRCPAGEVEVVRVVDHGDERRFGQHRFTYVVQVPGIEATRQGTDASELHAPGSVPVDYRFQDTYCTAKCSDCGGYPTYANTKIVSEPIERAGKVYPGMCTTREKRVCVSC